MDIAFLFDLHFSLFAEGGYSYLWRNTGLSFLSLNGGAELMIFISGTARVRTASLPRKFPGMSN
jgi:hypothetical protein